VSGIVGDDHLLGDVVGDTVPAALAGLLGQHVVATTNLYYYRLCRAALAARGGALTGSWSPERREQAARALVALSPDIEVLSMRTLAFRMAELARDHQLSALGAEAVAAAEAHGGGLFVWEGDDGRNIRACCKAVGVAYRVVSRK
jgi:hypothetical protein